MTSDDAYANSAHIPDGDSYYARWEAKAAAYREGAAGDWNVPYGSGARQWVDYFWPENDPRGTVAFVHGGYWLAGSPRMFSHLARGAVDAGFVCAMLSYTLAPEARISDITREIAAAMVAIGDYVPGPLYLVGHSAGGHLVARMACQDMAAQWSTRVCRVMAISPLSDLEPLRATSMNATLGIDADEAMRESPIHHQRQDVPVTAWVGGGERPAFLDQAMGLRNVWGCDLTVEAEKHHFDVIDGLEDATNPMMRALLR